MLSAKFAKINLKKIQLTYLRPILFSNVRKTTFSPVSEQLDLPKEEEKVLEYWNKIDAFKLQLDKTKHLKPYTFYDGPPFATGLPHYGHICAGTIKDVVTRYASQTGHYVERKFGWDCHGLPIEYEIDKEYGLRTREDVLKLGVEEYNKRCRGIVMKYSSEWREIVNRLGRWIDFDNDYKTMDPSFMESVWWVFKQMWDKGLIYRGAKVMPYSIGCATVLSNFEASQNFKEVKDPSVYIAFPLVDDPKTKLIAWTTTPWTLPSNLALCVNPTFEYVKIRDKKADETYILAKDRIGDLYKEVEDYEVLEAFLGKSLEGKRYIPLFDYFADEYKDNGAFQILLGNHVTNDAGTGVVHTAPGFGDDDYKICIKHSIVKPDKMPLPVDANGYFLNSVGEFSGQYIKDPATEKAIIKKIKENGRLVSEGQIKHSYPFCWRSEKPLIYRAITSWFVDVTAIKEQLLENNKKAYWVPTFAQEKRFHNWLEDAQDWCFSRNRFWGNPIPVWVSEDLEEQICIGSIEELERLSGVKNITDLHKEIIDKIEIPSQRGKGMLRRIDEVFDCWFESGSMPFAQVHYPFSTSHNEFEKRFPADFIGEGLDQTRGWFYTLNVISTAVRNINPYKNLIVNGLVLASDGKKMSKRLKNYPDPMKIVNSRGADALRLYLMNSPLVRAETLCFKEEGVFGIVKEVFNPWYNVYRFLVQNISRWEGNYGKNFVFDEKSILTGDKLDNIMDKWIIAANQHLIKSVREEMESYRLYTVVPKLLKFLESLTNGYVRLNRNRLKGDNGEEDQEIALKVLFDVLLKVTLLMAPFVPFITEMIYQNLTTKISDTSSYYEQSIHFLRIPEYNSNLLDDKIEGDIEVLMGILEDARILREKRKVSFKHPLGSLTVITDNEHLEQSLQPLLNYIQDEINVDKILFNREFSKFVGFQVAPNHKVLGQKLQKAYTEDFRKKLQALNEKDAAKFLKEGKLVVNGIELTSEHLSVKHILKREGLPDHFELGGESEFKILLDLRQDEDMKLRGVAREIVNRIQRLRKKSKLNLDDDVVIFIGFENGANLVQSAFDTQRVFMEKILKKPFHSMEKKPAYFRAIAGEEFEYENEKFTITICKNHIILKKDAIEKKHPGQYDDIERAVEELEFDKLKKTIQQEGKVLLSVGGKDFELHNGEDFSMSITAE